MYSDLCLGLGKGHIALLGLLDLSTVFDMVNHEIFAEMAGIVIWYNWSSIELDEVLHHRP